MLTRYLISAPVWGDRCVEEFCATALPALTRAIGALADARSVDVRLVVHTDRPEQVRASAGIDVDCRPVPAGARDFDCMSQAHREVIAMGLRGDVIMPFTAGAVISEHGLKYCADILDNPRIMAVLCAVPRVRAEGPIPVTDDAQTFMSWAWDHRHPMTDECTWPDGRSVDLSRTYFVCSEGTVVTRQALPHPLALRVDGRPLRFTPTVDANLIHCFDPSEMHLATDCRELALIKLTPDDKGYDRASATMRERAWGGGLIIADPHQRWCMQHRVVLCGDPVADGPDWQFLASVRGA